MNDDDRDNGGDGWMEEQEAGKAILDVIREKYMTDANRCIYMVGTQIEEDDFEMRCELEDMKFPCLYELEGVCEMAEWEDE